MSRIVFALGVICALSVVSCGGGGGDGGGDGGQPAPNFPTTGNFSISNQSPTTLNVTVMGESGPYLSVQATNLNIGGPYNLTAGTWTLNTGNTLRVDTGDLFGTLNIGVANPMTLSANANPTSGLLVVDLSQNHREEVHITATGVTVKQTTPTALQQALTWTQFLDIGFKDAAVPEYQRIAALAFQVLVNEVILNHIAFSASAFQMIAARETAMEQAGSSKSVSVNGDLCPVTNSTGNIALTWTDVSEPWSQVGPGDNFAYAFNQYWKNGASTADTMYVSGTMTYMNYIETSVPALGAGRVVFDNVVMKDVIEEPAGTYYYGGTYKVSGEYSVFFSK